MSCVPNCPLLDTSSQFTNYLKPGQSPRPPHLASPSPTCGSPSACGRKTKPWDQATATPGPLLRLQAPARPLHSSGPVSTRVTKGRAELCQAIDGEAGGEEKARVSQESRRPLVGVCCPATALRSVCSPRVFSPCGCSCQKWLSMLEGESWR